MGVYQLQTIQPSHLETYYGSWTSGFADLGTSGQTATAAFATEFISLTAKLRHGAAHLFYVFGGH